MISYYAWYMLTAASIAFGIIAAIYVFGKYLELTEQYKKVVKQKELLQKELNKYIS